MRSFDAWFLSDLSPKRQKLRTIFWQPTEISFQHFDGSFSRDTWNSRFFVTYYVVALFFRLPAFLVHLMKTFAPSPTEARLQKRFFAQFLFYTTFKFRYLSFNRISSSLSHPDYFPFIFWLHLSPENHFAAWALELFQFQDWFIDRN